MAELTALEIYGRKIFFINPSNSVQREIIQNLHKKEFEVYIIENYRDAKNVLRLNPDSILFINIDAQLTVAGWFNFIRSFDKEDALKSIIVYVISEKIKPHDIEIFSKFSEAEDTVLDFSKGTLPLSEAIDKILEKKNAKGKRQYIRINLLHDKDASLFWNHGSKMHQLKLIDLSSVGMAVRIPESLKKISVAKNYLIDTMTLRLGSRQVVVGAIIFAIKETPHGTEWVLLLPAHTPTAVKEEIRYYIFKTIEGKMQSIIDESKKDDNDYTLMDDYRLASKSDTKGKYSPFSHEPGHNFS